MRRDFLKDLGLSDEIIDKIMTQYGLDIEKYKTKKKEVASIINKKEIFEDGQAYIVEEYSNGAIVKYTKPISTSDGEQENNKLTDIELAILETSVNADYLVCLANLGL